MTPERWRQIEDIYRAALDPGKRAEVLGNADPELRREVEALLEKEGAFRDSFPPRVQEETIADSTLTMAGVGTQLGPYKIEASIGKGGMGEVFRAVDTRLGRKVAIKISNKQFDPRFAREAQAISALNHPHICTLYDTGPHYLVMELVEGETLASRLKKGKLSISDTLRYGAQIADALAEAHSKGITHRDLKPGNIMLAKNGVKVLDFGLAKLQTHPGETLTASNVVMGTPAYMAPEQREGREADARTDIYALGLILYEMATGRRPLNPPGEGAALDKLPQPLAHIVDRCLEENPEARWKSASEVRALLEWPSVASQSATAKRARRWIWPAVAVAAAAMIVSAIAVLVLSRPESTSAERQVIRFTIPLPAGAQPDLADFALSPDGRSVAITAGQSGRRNLYVHPVDSLSSKLIPNTDGAAQPFWSPDGSEIAFISEGRLQKVAASGGEVFTLADKLGDGFHGGTWNPQGTILFSANDRIHMVPASGGTPIELTQVGGRRVLSHPHFLPGGRTFLYTAEGDENGEGQGIYVGSLDNAGATVKLVVDRSKGVYVPPSNGAGTGYLLFRRKGILVAQRFDPGERAVSGSAIPLTSEPVISRTGYGPTVLFSSGGNALAYQTQTLERLVWVDRAGQLIEAAAAPGEYTNFRLSPDGSSVTMSVNRYDAEPSFVDIARLDLHRGTLERLTFHGDADLVPLFSPDGRRIAFTSRRLGAFDPFITDGPNQEKLVVDIKPTGGWPVDWSPDGRLLLWESAMGGLWVISLQDGGEPYELVSTKFKARGGQFSPDGNWMAYSSSESGREEVYVQAFPRGPRFTVTASGGKEPAWRRDGHELYYVAGDGMLTTVPVTFKNTSIEFGPPQRLFPAPLGQFRRNYEVSRDGQRFLIATPANPGGDAITVVLNWQAALKF